MQRKIITTKDNSKTLLIPDMNETYHSTHGALTEAEHIFIKHGIQQISTKKSSISVFEMGFGTGLNAILTYQFANKHQVKINYLTIEKYPLKSNEVSALNYSILLHLNQDEANAYNQMHSSVKPIQLSPYFDFKLITGDIKNTQLVENSFDIIYFDAFAPQHQPKLWEEDILLRMHNSLKPNGFLITYCAQGKFKRTLKSIGFEVVALKGPPGKREITKAIKK